MYTAVSRVRNYDNFYCIGKFKNSVIKIYKDVLLEYERLKLNNLFSTIKRNAISGDTITVNVHNVRLLPRHINDIVRDNINNDIILFTETQIKPSDSTNKIIVTLNIFGIDFNNH